jgi:hypothetical protein
LLQYLNRFGITHIRGRRGGTVSHVDAANPPTFAQFVFNLRKHTKFIILMRVEETLPAQQPHYASNQGY